MLTIVSGSRHGVDSRLHLVFYLCFLADGHTGAFRDWDSYSITRTEYSTPSVTDTVPIPIPLLLPLL